jgi:hypothetical protein
MAHFVNLLIRLVRLGRFRLVLIILVGIALCCPMLYADTTWVAGDVYGVWDTSGSPYMVTDTITVPMDSTLEIRPGVEIWFLDQETNRPALIVHGRLLAVGEESDSIYFLSSESGPARIDNDVTPGSEIRLEYCVVDSTIRGITSHEGTMILKHSAILAWGDPIWNSEQVDTIQYCYIHEGWIRLIYGSAVFDHNRGPYATLTIDGQQMTPIFNNQIRIIDINGGNATDIYDNDLYHAGSDCNSSHWFNNHIESGLHILGGSSLIEHNVAAGITLGECQAIVRDNQIGGALIDDSDVTFQRNLVVSDEHGIRIMGDGVNRILGNTIVFDDRGIYGSPYADTTYVYDNIFVGDAVNSTGIYCTSPRPFVIRYNDFHNVTEVTHNCELDTGNIFIDPRFCGGDPFDYQLQANSPCIDAGDPSSPLDPDSTRADMGAYYYDQLHDQPPALISPVVVNVQEGTTLRYVVRATDDYGPLRFGFWDLPGWLHIVHGGGTDWVADSAVISGRVPYDQEDFAFGVWVEDGLAQRDSQEVSVLVTPYTILAGEVTGVLTRDQSPYLVVEDVIVSAGDSLRIEPGVEIRFQWHPVSDLRRRMIVGGLLKAVGTPNDSIRFIPEYGDSLLEAWRGIWCIGAIQDTSKFEYTYFANAMYGVVADSQGAVVIEHSCLHDIGRGIWVIHNSRAAVDSCEFYEYIPNYSDFVYVNEASANVTNCYSEYIDAVEHGVHVYFRSGSYGEVHGCTFINGRSCSFGYSSRGDFIDNGVSQIGLGVILSNGSSGIIANNIFSNGGGLILGGADSVLVSNDCFYHTETSILMSFLPVQTNVINNIFLENQIGVQMLYGPGPFTNISYDDFFGNDSDLVNCLGDTTNIFLDPMVQDTVDFRLELGSPCIDAGDPDPFFNDPDSTRNDIGCWGGPWGESYPYTLVQTLNPKPYPLDFALLSPYPNPFNNILVIPFVIPVEKEVIINIYNILGQKVQEFSFPPLSPGAHRVIWDAGSMASGVYIIQLTTSGKELTRKALLLR